MSETVHYIFSTLQISIINVCYPNFLFYYAIQNFNRGSNVRIPKKLNPPINHQVQQSPQSRGHESHNGLATLLDAAMLAASAQEQDPGQQKMYVMNPIQPDNQHEHVTSEHVNCHVTPHHTQVPQTRVPKQHVVQQGNMVAQTTMAQNRAPQNVVHFENRVLKQPRASHGGATHVIPPATHHGTVYQVKADHAAHHPMGDHQYSGHPHQMEVQNTSHVVHQSQHVTHQNTASHQVMHQNTSHKFAHQNTSHHVAQQNISHQGAHQNTSHQVAHQNTFHQTEIQPGSHHQNRVSPAQLQPQSILPPSPHTQSGIPPQHQHLNRPPPAPHQNKGHGGHQTFEPYVPSVMQTPPKTAPHVVIDGGATSSRGTNRGRGRGRGRGQSTRGTRGRGRGLRGNATGLNMSQQSTK